MMASRLRERRGDQSRRDLVAVAIDCFSKHGYQGTSIDRIARAAGMTKGALYYHFKDKQDLLFGALDNQISGFERVVIDRVTQLKDPEAALHAVTEICVEQATVSKHRRFILTLMVEALDTYPELSNRFRDMMRRFREFLRHTVSIGQAKGVFRKDVDAALAAQLFVAAVMGTELQHYQDPTAVRLRESMHAVADLFCAWLAAPTPHPLSVARIRTSGGRSDADQREDRNIQADVRMPTNGRLRRRDSRR